MSVRLFEWPIYRGKTWTIEVPLYDGDGKQLTVEAANWSAAFLLEQNPYDEDAPAPLAGNVELEPDGNTSLARITVPETTTALMERFLKAWGTLTLTSTEGGEQVARRYEIPVLD